LKGICVFHFPGIAKELFLQLRQYCRSLSRANELGYFECVS
jgi:hypothetical protein